MTETDFDVAIIGYGLVGQAAASRLADYGHRVVVLERWDSLYGLPRTISLDGEVMRIVQACGDLDEALSERSEMAGFQVLDDAGNVLGAQNFTGIEICGFHCRISFYQPHVELAMHDRAVERGAQVDQGWELVALDQDDERVTLRVRRHEKSADSDSGVPERTLSARYVIGADGARSTVRDLLGIDREDFGFSNAYLSVDVLRKSPLLQIPTDMCTSINAANRAVTIMPIGEKRIRFEFAVDPEADNSEHLTREGGYALLDEGWGLGPDDVEIYRQVVYPFTGKLAHQFRHGRVFLAGDAAHLMPPFMGQGAGTGMRDAMTLAWELDLVLRGVSDESLLDVYERERKPHSRFYVEGSCHIGRIAMGDTSEHAKPGAEEPSDGEDLPLGMDYQDGVLHCPGGELGYLAGTLTTQGTVRRDGKEGLFDDVVGHGFCLVGWNINPLSALDDDRRGILERLGTKVVTLTAAGQGEFAWESLDHRYAAYFEENGIVAYLQRPDFRVFAALRTLDELPDAIDDLAQQLLLRERQPA